MEKIIGKIHDAIGGDYTDINPEIEEAAGDLAAMVEWYNNPVQYIQAAQELLAALTQFDDSWSQKIREAIAKAVRSKKAFNIDAVKDYIENYETNQIKLKDLFDKIRAWQLEDS